MLQQTSFIAQFLMVLSLFRSGTVAVTSIAPSCPSELHSMFLIRSSCDIIDPPCEAESLVLLAKPDLAPAALAVLLDSSGNAFTRTPRAPAGEEERSGEETAESGVFLSKDALDAPGLRLGWDMITQRH